MLIGGKCRLDEGARVEKEEISMSAENEALVRRYVEEVYDQRKLDVVDEISRKLNRWSCGALRFGS
jgi:hypothetical protein